MHVKSHCKISIARKFGVDAAELVRLKQPRWGKGLNQKSPFKEGTELILPRPQVKEEEEEDAIPATYVAAENETPLR